MTSIVDRISEKIFGSPIAQVAERELADEAFAARQQLAAERVALEAGLVDAQRDLTARLAPMVEAEAALEAELASRRAARQAIERPADLARQHASIRLDQVRAQLAATAPRAIAVLIDELRALAQRDDFRDLHGYNVERQYVLVWHNRESLTRRREVIATRLIPQLEALKLEALEGDALTERLEAIRADLPALDEVPPRFRHLLRDGGDEAA
jgi:hypothetical protein